VLVALVIVAIQDKLVTIPYLVRLPLLVVVAVLWVVAVLVLQRQAVLVVVAAHHLVHQRVHLELLVKDLLVAIVDLGREITRLLAAAALVLLEIALQMQVPMALTAALARHQVLQAHQ
jgi:hypothetical protein